MTEEAVDVQPLVPSGQIARFLLRLRSLLVSQQRNLHALSLLTIFNFLAAGLYFLTQVKIANVIGKENFGHLAYAMALGLYAQATVRYGMDRTLVRDLIHYPNRFAELVAGSLLLRGGIQLLLITGLVTWKCAFDASGMLSWGVMAVVIAISLKSLDLQPVYDAWMRMGRHAAYNLIQRSLYFAFVWAVVLWSPSHLSVTWIGFGLLGTQVFYLLLQQQWAFRRIDFRTIKVSLAKVAAELSKSNLWIWLASLAVLSFGSLNQIILKYYCGAAELGGYAASWQIAAAAGLLLTQVGRVGNPKMANITKIETSKTRKIRFLFWYSAVMFFSALLVCIPVLLFPELILKTLFRPEYVSETGTLRVFGVYMLVLSLTFIGSQYVVSAGLEKIYFASVAVGGVLSPVLCVVLIPYWAGFGAALSLLIAHSVSMAFYWMVMIYDIAKEQSHPECDS